MQDVEEAMILARFDAIHRLIRDLKFSLGHAAGGVFLKAQFYSSHIWSINQRPFRSGIFQSQKRRLLDVFLRTCTVDHPIFRDKYGWRIARDFGMLLGHT